VLVSDTVRLSSMLFPRREAAVRALEAVGGVVVPELDLSLDVPGLGVIQRTFAYLGNVVEKANFLENPVLYKRVASVLDSADNERVAKKLEQGRLDYMPVNKRTARKLVPDLHEVGLHLPWAFRPMNFDFGARLEELSERRPFRFRVFYSQRVDISADGETATVQRVFSLPVQGSAHGTFQEPIFDEMLDEDVGLFIEANVRVG
jgi:hypothetical protein